MILAYCALQGRTGHEAAWALLETTYRRAVGQSLPPVARTERGKPDFCAGSWHFSLTHTRNHAFCVLSREAVGIDAEELDRPIRLELAEKILSPEEYAQFARAEDPRQALLRFWVLKEAAAKQTGMGLQGYPNKTKFSLTDPRVKILSGCLVAVVEEGSEFTEPEVIYAF